MGCAYTSRNDSFQKGLQSSALEVDSTGDVAVDGAGVWVFDLQGLDLAPEVRRLLACGDSGGHAPTPTPTTSTIGACAA